MLERICELSINGGDRAKDTIRYDFTYSGMHVSMYLAKQDKVFIDLNEGIAKKANVLEMPDLYSLLSRAHLAYALVFSANLKVTSVRFGGKCFDENNTDVGFPFISSAIGKRLNLSVKWRDKKLVEKMLSYKQVPMKHNRNFSAVYSFIAANSCKREIDKFTHLWECMNSYYHYKAERVGVGNNSERGQIVYLLKELGCNQDMMNQTERNEDKTREKYCRLAKLLRNLCSGELYAFYRACLNDIDGKGCGKYQEILERINHLGITRLKLFGALLIEFPYYLRCNYFHGTMPTMLFEQVNGIELSALRVVNFFLKEFLNEKIPEMFQV